MYKEFYQQNHDRQTAAEEAALEWWASLPAAPNHEDRMMHSWAPFIRNHLTQDRVLQLSEDEFAKVFCKVHAFRNYADRVKYTVLGLTSMLDTMKSEERGDLVARQLFHSTTSSGKTILELLHFVLYDGRFEKLPDRLYEVARGNEAMRIRLAGLSTFGEVVGWAIPEQFPPRNDRTNKALRALGYDVRVYS